MTFLTIMGVTEIYRFRLNIEGKTGREIPESSRLEFLELAELRACLNFTLDSDDLCFWYKRKK